MFLVLIELSSSLLRLVISAWNVQRVDATAAMAGAPVAAASVTPQPAPAAPQATPFPPAQPEENSTDDLPF